MPLFNWADTGLPKPSINYGGTIETSAIRSKMDDGKIRQRQRFESGFRSIKAQWVFNDDQFALFQGVYQYKLHQGADWFTMNLPLGDGFKDYTVRFDAEAAYSYQYQESMYWQVSGSLETEVISPLTEAEVDDLLP